MATNKKQSSKLQIQSKYNRNFSEGFRRQIVSDLDAGLLTVGQASELYSLSRTSIYKWIYRYSVHHQKGTKQVIQMESEAHKTLELRKRVAELERRVGQKQLAIDFLEQVIALADEELGMDLKKNFAAPSSNTSEINDQNPTP